MSVAIAIQLHNFLSLCLETQPSIIPYCVLVHLLDKEDVWREMCVKMSSAVRNNNALLAFARSEVFIISNNHLPLPDH